LLLALLGGRGAETGAPGGRLQSQCHHSWRTASFSHACATVERLALTGQAHHPTVVVESATPAVAGWRSAARCRHLVTS